MVKISKTGFRWVEAVLAKTDSLLGWGVSFVGYVKKITELASKSVYLTIWSYTSVKCFF